MQVLHVEGLFLLTLQVVPSDLARAHVLSLSLALGFGLGPVHPMYLNSGLWPMYTFLWIVAPILSGLLPIYTILWALAQRTLSSMGSCPCTLVSGLWCCPNAPYLLWALAHVHPSLGSGPMHNICSGLLPMYTLLWAVVLPIVPYLLWALAHVHSSLGGVVAHCALSSLGSCPCTLFSGLLPMYALGNAHVVYGWADARVEHSLG